VPVTLKHPRERNAVLAHVVALAQRIVDRVMN
jgi:hypothetical protein